jgi:F-type H+-transporting ATPase subunit b
MSHALQAFIVQLLGFGLMVWLLVKFVRPVLSKALSDRSRGIEETFHRIEQDTAEASRRLADLKEKLSAIDQETRKRLEAMAHEADRTKAQTLADAQAQAEAILEKAHREIRIEGEKAVLELRHEATELTLRAAEELVQSTMNDQVQDRLVQNYLSKLEAARRA